MRARRGVALLAALWLVVGIAAVALQFGLEARERRTLGIAASERGIQRAAALGALALVQARLDQALRVAPTGTNINRLAASDPWLGIDSMYSGPVYVDSMEVLVEAQDLGEKLNINSAGETELQSFFSFLLKDYSKATELAQSIMDWRDPDSIPRPNGAERDAYIKAGRLALPMNAPFRDVSDLADVMGMTPEIYAEVSPYLTTRGPGLINVNTAPPAVLRSMIGMTDATLNMILQLRSQGRRINSMADLMGQQQTGGGRGGARPGQLNQAQTVGFAARAIYTTTMVELTFTARTGPQASPTKLMALLQRLGTTATVQYEQW